MMVYGWKAWRLADAYTFAELEALRQIVIQDPKSANPAHATGSIYLYSPAAQRKLDALAWAVTYKLMEKRKAA